MRNADGVPTGAREPVLECGGVCEAAVADAFGKPDAVTLVSKAAAGWELLRWLGCTPDRADLAVCGVDMKTDRPVTAFYQDCTTGTWNAPWLAFQAIAGKPVPRLQAGARPRP